MAQYAEGVIDSKYQAQMDIMLKQLTQEEKLEASGAISDKEHAIHDKVVENIITTVSENTKRESQEVKSLADSGISESDIDIRAVPNITDMNGQIIDSPMGELKIQTVDFADAESVLDSSIAFSLRSPKLGILIGHSSSLSLGDPLYRKSFAFLSSVNVGDTIVIGGRQYRVIGRNIVSAQMSGVEAILSIPTVPTLRLVTCWPI